MTLYPEIITLDFDDVQGWGPSLTAYLASRFSLTDAGEAIRRAKPEFLEDASVAFFRVVFQDKATFNSAVDRWLSRQTIAAYHGSRLSSPDIVAVAERGLSTLNIERRRGCLREKLSVHPQWSEDLLERALEKLGPTKQLVGNREGQLHLTISRGGLLTGFPHYLTHGSEFDQQVAKYLFGDGGMELLAQYGTSVLIRVAVPGEQALIAANPYWFHTDPEAGRNLVREVILVWAHWLAYPDVDVSRLEYDCGLIFKQDIPSDWIVSIDQIEQDTR